MRDIMEDRNEIINALANDVLDTTIDFGMERLESTNKIQDIRAEIITSLIEVLASYMAHCIEDGANREEGVEMALKNLNEAIEDRLGEDRSSYVPRKLH